MTDDLMGNGHSPSLNINFSVRKGCFKQSSAEGRLAGSRMNIEARNCLKSLCSTLKICRLKISYKVNFKLILTSRVSISS